MPFASPEIQAFAGGFPLSVLHFLIALVVLLAGLAAHAFLSPHREVMLAREGNPAAAIALGGSILAMAITVSAAVLASATALEVVLWAVSVVVLQLLFNRLAELALRGLPERIADGEAASAWLMISVRIAIALVLAAAVSA